MKRIIFIINLFININICFGQFTITDQHVLRSPDVVSVSIIDTLGFNPGTPGSNVIWDFSNISVIGPNYFTNYYSVVSTSSCQVDSVNLGVWSSGNSETYYNLNNFVLTYRGVCYENTAGPEWYYRWYTDAPIEMIFPFNYNDSFSDTALGNVFDGQPYTNWEAQEHHLKTYDSYGTMILPWITINNVARVSKFSYTRDSVTFTTGNLTSRVRTISGYDWYAENQHGPFLKFVIFSDTIYTTTGTLNNYYFTQIYFLSNGPLSNQENPLLKELIQILPNPSKGILKIKLTNRFANENPIAIKLYDALGRLIFEDEMRSHNRSLDLDLSNNKSGLYMMQFQQDNYYETIKLILE